MPRAWLVKAAGALDLPPKLQHCAVPVVEVDPAMSGHAVHLQAIIRNSLSSRLVGSREALCRFQNKDRSALSRQRLDQRPRVQLLPVSSSLLSRKITGCVKRPASSKPLAR